MINAGVDLVILATPPGLPPDPPGSRDQGQEAHLLREAGGGGRDRRPQVYGLVEESKKKNIAIVAGTQRRHQKGYIETIKQINDEAIGEIVSARCSWNGHGIWFHDRTAGQPDAAYQIHNWYHFLWVCGDHIVEQHVHNLDVINWVMNDHPVKAVGMGGRAARPVGAAGRGRQHLGPLRGRVRVQERREDVLVLPPHPGRQRRVRDGGRHEGRASLQDGAWSINRKPIEGEEIPRTCRSTSTC